MDEALRYHEQQLLTNEELDETISAVISLSKYIKEKDLFWQVSWIRIPVVNLMIFPCWYFLTIEYQKISLGTVTLNLPHIF